MWLPSSSRRLVLRQPRSSLIRLRHHRPPSVVLLRRTMTTRLSSSPTSTSRMPTCRKYVLSSRSCWTCSWDQQSLANSFNTMTMVPPMVTNWVTDSSTSNCTTSDVGNLTSVHPPHINDPSSIIVENRSSLSVTSVGDTALPGPFYHNNVLVTPDIIQNHLSVHCFTTDN
jgi:hypothetical protein